MDSSDKLCLHSTPDNFTWIKNVISNYAINIPDIELEGQTTGVPFYTREYEFTPEDDWFSRNIPVWKEVLQGFVDRPDTHYLELGVYEGRSLLWILDNLRPSSATGVDPYPRENEDLLYERAKRNIGDRAELFREFGTEWLQRNTHRSFDIIYIDGDHHARPTLEHAIFCWRLLRPNGMLIFDDYHWKRREYPSEHRPKMAIDFFWHLYREEAEPVHWGWQVILRKRH